MSDWELQGGCHGPRPRPKKTCASWRACRVGCLWWRNACWKSRANPTCARFGPTCGSTCTGGGIQAPYRDTFNNLIPHVPGCPPMHYLETYNASEGFFAYQDDLMRDDMALLDGPRHLLRVHAAGGTGQSPSLGPWSFGKWKKGQTYALVISTNAGLWRYLVGDLVTITSKIPFRMHLAGRITSHLNLVGEEVMEHQTDQAVCKVCEGPWGPRVQLHGGACASTILASPWATTGCGISTRSMQPSATALAKRLDASASAFEWRLQGQTHRQPRLGHAHRSRWCPRGRSMRGSKATSVWGDNTRCRV